MTLEHLRKTSESLQAPESGAPSLLTRAKNLLSSLRPQPEPAPQDTTPERDQFAMFQTPLAETASGLEINLPDLHEWLDSATEWFSTHGGRLRTWLESDRAKAAGAGGKIGLLIGSSFFINPALGAAIGMGFYGHEAAKKLHHLIKQKGATNLAETATALKEAASENWHFLWGGESREDREARKIGMIIGVGMIALPTLIAKALPTDELLGPLTGRTADSAIKAIAAAALMRTLVKEGIRYAERQGVEDPQDFVNQTLRAASITTEVTAAALMSWHIGEFATGLLGHLRDTVPSPATPISPGTPAPTPETPLETPAWQPGQIPSTEQLQLAIEQGHSVVVEPGSDPNHPVITAYDLNSDGVLDATTNHQTAQTWVTAQEDFHEGRPLLAVDSDADGRADSAAVDYNYDNRLDAYYDTDQVLTDSQAPQSPPAPVALDLNSNGTPDLIRSSHSDGVVNVYEDSWIALSHDPASGPDQEITLTNLHYDTASHSWKWDSAVSVDGTHSLSYDPVSDHWAAAPTPETPPETPLWHTGEQPTPEQLAQRHGVGIYTTSGGEERILADLDGQPGPDAITASDGTLLFYRDEVAGKEVWVGSDQTYLYENPDKNFANGFQQAFIRDQYLANPSQAIPVAINPDNDTFWELRRSGPDWYADLNNDGSIDLTAGSADTVMVNGLVRDGTTGLWQADSVTSQADSQTYTINSETGQWTTAETPAVVQETAPDSTTTTEDSASAEPSSAQTTPTHTQDEVQAMLAQDDDHGRPIYYLSNHGPVELAYGPEGGPIGMAQELFAEGHASWTGNDVGQAGHEWGMNLVNLVQNHAGVSPVAFPGDTLESILDRYDIPDQEAADFLAAIHAAAGK